MEYPLLGTVDAADGGRAGPYNSSGEREGGESAGARFDRERARRLWEAVSSTQPVGREEGESRAWKLKPLTPLLDLRGAAQAGGAGRGPPSQGSGHTPWHPARLLA